VTNKLVRNERRKLTATYINGIALALIAVGVFTQAVAFAQSLTLTIISVVVMFACSALSLSLHWLARHLLGGLEE
jgi:ABC-type cobalamin transport system permease subunit